MNGVKEVGAITESQAKEIWIMFAGDPNDPHNNGMAD